MVVVCEVVGCILGSGGGSDVEVCDFVEEGYQLFKVYFGLVEFVWVDMVLFVKWLLDIWCWVLVGQFGVGQILNVQELVVLQCCIDYYLVQFKEGDVWFYQVCEVVLGSVCDLFKNFVIEQSLVKWLYCSIVEQVQVFLLIMLVVVLGDFIDLLWGNVCINGIYICQVWE